MMKSPLERIKSIPSRASNYTVQQSEEHLQYRRRRNLKVLHFKTRAYKIYTSKHNIWEEATELILKATQGYGYKRIQNLDQTWETFAGRLYGVWYCW